MTEPVGLREQNKVEKLERIKTAARELFSEKGFDAATTREIAKKARVAMGTLFNYVDDKRDLIFLVMADGLNSAIDEACASTDFESPLLDQLVNAFARLYHYFSQNQELSRVLLRELAFYSSGKLAAGFQATRHQLIRLIESSIAEAQKRGQIPTSENPALMARGIFFIYSGAVRWWIAEETPAPQAGLDELRSLLKPYLYGILRKTPKK